MAEKLFQWTVTWHDENGVMQKRLFDAKSPALKFEHELKVQHFRASVTRGLNPKRDQPGYRFL
jgi:hypothetical protein